MRTEGVYTYVCNKCDLTFAVVARFSVKDDYSKTLKCPKCSGKAAIKGEGYINYHMYEEDVHPVSVSQHEEDVQLVSVPQHEEYPLVLTAPHIAKIMGVSQRVAYEIMEYTDFPLIRIGRLKKVNRESFFSWLEKRK